VYNEDLLDLLNQPGQKEKKNNPNWYKEATEAVTVREKDGLISWTGAQEVQITSIEDMMEVLNKGLADRTTFTTSMNDTSSRSHAVLTLTLRQNRWVESPLTTEGEQRTGDWQVCDFIIFLQLDPCFQVPFCRFSWIRATEENWLYWYAIV
jgi:hypothetical protein